jgi:hypothetical protein
MTSWGAATWCCVRTPDDDAERCAVDVLRRYAV